MSMEQLREAGWGSCFTQYEQMLTRGQAMDLLMLAKAPEDEDRQLLEFFNIKIEASNALVVSQQAAILQMNDQEMQKWNERPATPVQKEAIRYFQGKVPRSISAESATQVLSSIKSELYQTGNADKWTSWLLFSDTWLQLQSSEICIQYDIKKPTPIKIREALCSLIAEDIAEWNDKDVVVQRLVELYPELELRSTPVSMQVV